MSAGVQAIPCIFSRVSKVVLLMGEQARPALAFLLLHGSSCVRHAQALGWKDLAYSSAAATCALLSRNSILGCLVALHATGTSVWKGKWSSACWGFRKVRLGTLPSLLCGVSGRVSTRMFCKGFIASLRSYLVPTDRFTGEWFCSLPTGACDVHDIVVQSPRHSTAPSVPRRLLHQHAASSEDINVSF